MSPHKHELSIQLSGKTIVVLLNCRVRRNNGTAHSYKIHSPRSLVTIVLFILYLFITCVSCSALSKRESITHDPFYLPMLMCVAVGEEEGGARFNPGIVCSCFAVRLTWNNGAVAVFVGDSDPKTLSPSSLLSLWCHSIRPYSWMCGYITSVYLRINDWNRRPKKPHGQLGIYSLSLVIIKSQNPSRPTLVLNYTLRFTFHVNRGKCSDQNRRSRKVHIDELIIYINRHIPQG